jgi:hypothetical protein
MSRSWAGTKEDLDPRPYTRDSTGLLATLMCPIIGPLQITEFIDSHPVIWPMIPNMLGDDN